MFSRNLFTGSGAKYTGKTYEKRVQLSTQPYAFSLQCRICYACLFCCFIYLVVEISYTDLLSCCIFSVCTSCDQAVFIYFVYDTAIFLNGLKCLIVQVFIKCSLLFAGIFCCFIYPLLSCSSVKLLYLLAPIRNILVAMSWSVRDT